MKARITTILVEGSIATATEIVTRSVDGDSLAVIAVIIALPIIKIGIVRPTLVAVVVAIATTATAATGAGLACTRIVVVAVPTTGSIGGVVVGEVIVVIGPRSRLSEPCIGKGAMGVASNCSSILLVAAHPSVAISIAIVDGLYAGVTMCCWEEGEEYQKKVELSIRRDPHW